MKLKSPYNSTSRFLFRTLALLTLLTCGTIMLAASGNQANASQEIGATEEGLDIENALIDDISNGEKAVEEKEPAAEVLPAATPATEQPKIAKKFVRFHMWDGSIVGGEVQLGKTGPGSWGQEL